VLGLASIVNHHGGLQTFAAHIEERLKSRRFCIVFQKELARVWSGSQRGAANAKRYAQIRAFAKAHGWSATIHDPGIRVTFRKLPTDVQPVKRVTNKSEPEHPPPKRRPAANAVRFTTEPL
jgi:hypothetical protein